VIFSECSHISEINPMLPEKPEQPDILVCENCGATSATDSTVRKTNDPFGDGIMEDLVLCEDCRRMMRG